MTATYKKIDGEWFLVIPAADTENLIEGQEITVTKRDGTTKTEILGSAVSIQKNYTIASIGGSAKQQPRWSRGGDGVERNGEMRRNPRTGRVWRESARSDRD